MPQAATAPEVEDMVFCYLCRCRLSSLEPVADNRTRVNVHNNMHIKHWILPKALHTQGVGMGFWTRAESNAAFISVCYICHQAAENSFTPIERALFVNTASKLKNALIEVGWRDVRNSGKLTPAKLKNHKWRTQELLDYKTKNCTLNNVTDFWSTEGDLNSLVDKGEALDICAKVAMEGEALTERLETRLTTKHEDAIAGVKDQIQVTNDKLEKLKKKIHKVEEVVRKDKGDDDDLAIEAKIQGLANKELIGLLRRDLDGIKEDLDNYKESKTREDRARDDKIQLLLAGLEEFKATQSQTKRIQTQVNKLEWEFTESTAAVTPSSAKDKGKRKWQEEQPRPPQFPPTANEVMANPEAVLAQKNRKIWTQVSHTDSETTDASENEGADVRRLSKVRAPPAKRQRVNDGVEVSISKRPVARRPGQSGPSASASASTRPAVTRNVAPNNATTNNDTQSTPVEKVAAETAPSRPDNGPLAKQVQQNSVKTNTAAVVNNQPASSEEIAAAVKQAALAKQARIREDAAKAVREAVIAIVPVKVSAVDIPIARQAAVASSSGTSNVRPPLHSSPRASASGTSSKPRIVTPKKEEQNKPQNGNAIAGSSNLAANAPARITSNDFHRIFPSLSSREDSVMSELPDLPFQRKKAKLPATTNTADNANDEPVFVAQRASARSERTKQRRSKNKNTSVKPENEEE